MAAPFDKSGIIEFFLIEAGEHLQNLNKGLLSLEKDSKDSAIIDELFRAAHTLKGSAAMMGFQGISDVAHKAEDMLGQFRSGSIPIRKETLNFLFDTVDAIKLMVDGVAGNKTEDPLVVDSIKQSYKDVMEKIRAVPGPPAPAAPSEKPAPPSKPVVQKAPPATPAAAPAPKPAPAPASPKAKDELDLAWERTFAVGDEKPAAKLEKPAEEKKQTTLKPPAAAIPPSDIS